MKKNIQSNINPRWSGEKSTLPDFSISEQSDFYDLTFTVVTGFKNKEIIAACKNVEKHLGIRQEDLTIKKLYDLTHPQERSQLLAEDRAMQKLIYQNPEARSKLPHAFCTKKHRLRLFDRCYWEVRRSSRARQFDTNGLPTFISHRYLINEIPSADYVASDLSIFSKYRRHLFKEEALVRKMVSESLFSNLNQQFTPTQLDICEYLSTGLTSKKIAVIMGISPKTVEKHRSNIIERGKAISSRLDTALKVTAYLQKRGLI